MTHKHFKDYGVNKWQGSEFEPWSEDFTKPSALSPT